MQAAIIFMVNHNHLPYLVEDRGPVVKLSVAVSECDKKENVLYWLLVFLPEYVNKEKMCFVDIVVFLFGSVYFSYCKVCTPE